jgi:hypothetical protein
MIFKYEELRLFFSELNKSGKSQLFKDWTGDKVFLLRHDVDFDINLAHKLAVIEKEENVVSTFFMLTTNESYIALSKKNRTLWEMVADYFRNVTHSISKEEMWKFLKK